jgi:hypothetical protein
VFAYIVRRILATIPVMGVVAVFVFSLLYFSPGDPAAIIAGDLATVEDIEKIRQQLGLNEPFLVRFSTWLFAILQGDLGNSIFSSLPVTTLIGQRLEATISLSLTTILLSVSVAVPLGVLAAARAGGGAETLHPRQHDEAESRVEERVQDEARPYRLGRKEALGDDGALRDSHTESPLGAPCGISPLLHLGRHQTHHGKAARVLNPPKKALAIGSLNGTARAAPRGDNANRSGLQALLG